MSAWCCCCCCCRWSVITHSNQIKMRDNASTTVSYTDEMWTIKNHNICSNAEIKSPFHRNERVKTAHILSCVVVFIDISRMFAIFSSQNTVLFLNVRHKFILHIVSCVCARAHLHVNIINGHINNVHSTERDHSLASRTFQYTLLFLLLLLFARVCW